MKAGYLPSVRHANIPMYALSTAIMLHLVIGWCICIKSVDTCVLSSYVTSLIVSLTSTGASLLTSLVGGE